MYEAFMKDPETPAAVRKAKKSVVLRLLAQRAVDNYLTIDTNETAELRFRVPERLAGRVPSVRLRFTNTFDMRQDVRGALRLGEASGTVSNITQAVIEVPLSGSVRGGEGTLSFANEGKSALMLRPRRDVTLLVPADAFWRNLLRAYAELVAMLSLLVSFGVFLGAGLGRPVALFTAVVALVVSEMSPSVLEQYPDELEADRIDAIGLAVTRAAAEATHPVSSLAPLEKLSQDACVEPREVARAAAANLVLAPLLFALLSALAMPRKTGD